MTRAFIHSPLSPLMLLASLALGILGLVFTPRQEDPQISVPMVDIFFGYPGASSHQVSTLATVHMNRMLKEIPGVKHVYSATQRGGAMATVQFEVGENLENSVVKVHDKLMSNFDKIPPGVSKPMVKAKGVDDVPVVTLTLWSHDVDDAALRLVALDVLQRLKEVPDTSQSFVTGGRSEQIRVETYPERLRGFGVSIGQLAHTIQTANSEKDAGYGESGGSSFRLYTGSFLRNAEDVKRLVVGVRNGSPVYVRDVANVIEGPSETKNMVSYYSGKSFEHAFPDSKLKAPQGAPAVTIAVAKKINTNGVTVANAVLKHLEHLKGRVIPDNIEVTVTRNYGKTANDKVNDLIFKLFVATGAVTVLVWWALGFRASMVVLIVIPVVILVTVLSAWILGFTIDRVSLFALIFSIGILVDDAIVVVENIYRRWLLKGEIDTETSVDAVREVGNPTILATFTVIAALLPMGFVSGMMGPYMAPIPVLGSVAMLFSLFAAFIFTPYLAMRIRPSMAKLEKDMESEHRQSQQLEKMFRWILTPLIESKAKARLFKLGLYGSLIACFGLFYTTDVAVKMLPLDNKPEFNVVVNLPEGSALPRTANVVQRLTEQLLDIEEVTAIQTYVGTASPFNFNGMVRHYYLRDKAWEADIQVQLLDKNERELTSHELAVIARDRLTPIAQQMGARIQVVEMPPGPPVLQTMVAEVYGPDDATRRKVAADLTRIFQEAEGVVDVDNYMQDDYKMWRFVVDGEKAVRRGVSVDDINKHLSMVMGEFKLGDVKVGTVLEPRYIVLQVPFALRSQFSRLGQLPIQTSSGTTIPLAELGHFQEVFQDPVIFHKDLRPVEYVTAEVAGRLAAPIYGMLTVEDLLEQYTAPDGVKLESFYIGPPGDNFKSAFEWTGEWTVTYETFRDMGIAFAAALVLIYMLVVWEFGNFRLPGIIMAPIPLTLIGIIPGHWFIGYFFGGGEFTATSMIGFIALAGIIVRNSILLVDFSAQAVEAGMTVSESVIQACRTRTRPIMITAFALVAGSSVIITDPIFQGMAISLMFGVLVSTVLTLVVIPLGCVAAKDSFMARVVAEHPKAAAKLAEIEARETEKKAAEAPAPAPAADREPGPIAKAFGMIAMVGYLVRAMGYFVVVGVKTLFGKVGGFFSMIFYMVRALPYFVLLFVREGVKSLFSGGSSAPPAPAPDPAPAPAPEPKPAAPAKSEPEPKAEEPKAEEPKAEEPEKPKPAAKKKAQPKKKAEPKAAKPAAKAQEKKAVASGQPKPAKKPPAAKAKPAKKTEPAKKDEAEKPKPKRPVTKKATAANSASKGRARRGIRLRPTRSRPAKPKE